IALRVAERLAVLAVRDERVVPGLLDVKSAGHHGGILSFGEEPRGAGFHADLAEQCRQGHARPLTRAREAIDQLRGQVGSAPPVARRAVAGALEETESWHTGESLEGLQVKLRGSLDHPVDE